MGNNAAFFHLEPGEYICFVDASTVDLASMAQQTTPEGVSIRLFPVRCNPGQTISQAVLLQKMDAMDKFLLAQHGDPFAEPNEKESPAS